MRFSIQQINEAGRVIVADKTNDKASSHRMFTNRAKALAEGKAPDGVVEVALYSGDDLVDSTSKCHNCGAFEAVADLFPDDEYVRVCRACRQLRRETKYAAERALVVSGCAYCDGTGDCPGCVKRDGKMIDRYGYAVACDVCDGAGVCPYCADPNAATNDPTSPNYIPADDDVDYMAGEEKAGHKDGLAAADEMRREQLDAEYAAGYNRFTAPAFDPFAGDDDDLANQDPLEIADIRPVLVSVGISPWDDLVLPAFADLVDGQVPPIDQAKIYLTAATAAELARVDGETNVEPEFMECDGGFAYRTLFDDGAEKPVRIPERHIAGGVLVGPLPRPLPIVAEYVPALANIPVDVLANCRALAIAEYDDSPGEYFLQGIRVDAGRPIQGVDFQLRPEIYEMLDFRKMPGAFDLWQYPDTDDPAPGFTDESVALVQSNSRRLYFFVQA